jgi:hypothetical protein
MSTCLLLGLSACPGGRRPEKRDEATHVFIGQVQALHEEREDRVVNYLVEIKIESVEKGEGIEPGSTVPVHCYIAIPSPDLVRDKPKKKIWTIGRPPGSYDRVPKEKDRVKVYARKTKETYDGIYPNWYDAAPSN